MATLRQAAFAAVMGLVVGCGGSKSSPEVPVGPGEPTEGTALAASGADLSPVVAPADLFAVARIKTPGKLVDSGTRWTGFPFDWRSLLAKEAPGVTDVLQLDAPIDAAAALDPAAGMEPNVFFAVSVGITSADAAADLFKSRGESVERLPKGAYRIRMGTRPVCLATAALGPSPARLVCAPNEESVDALAPYMTRGLPTENLSASDLHVRVSAAPFRTRYGAQLTMLKTAGVPFVMREIALDHPRFDRALKDVLYGLVDEIIDIANDLDSVTVDAALDGQRGLLNASLSIRMQARKSWLSQTVAAQVSKASPAPADFWTLPKESLSASYRIAGDPKRAEKMARALSDLLDGALDYADLGKRRRDPLVEAFEKALLIEGATVYARLPSDSSLSKAKGATPPEKLQHGIRHAIGTHLLGVRGGGDRLTTLISEVTKAINDHGLRARIKKEKIIPADALPRARQRGPRGGGLPAGTRLFQLDVPATAFAIPFEDKGKKPPRLKSLPIFLVAMLHGDKTWFGLSADEKKLYETLKEVRSKDAAKSGLAARAGLESLKTTKAVSGGFSTIREILEGLDSPLSDLDDTDELFDSSLETARILATLPNQGQTPVVWHGTITADGPTMTVSAAVPKAAIQDVAAGIAAATAGAMRR